MINATVLAKHPAFFDPGKKLLAEVLPGSVYRFTKEEGKGQTVSIVMSPLANRFFLDARPIANIREVVSPSLLEDSDYYDVFEKGKKLLEENGYSVEIEEEDKKRLNSLAQRFRSESSVQPEEFRPGDHAAMLFEQGRWKSITTFQIVEKNSYPVSQEEIQYVLKDGGIPPGSRITEGGSVPLTAMEELKNLPRYFFRMAVEDHEWLKKAAFFYQGEASPEEGGKIFDRLKELAETSGRQRSFHYRPEKTMIGNVAI